MMVMMVVVVIMLCKGFNVVVVYGKGCVCNC